MTAAAQAHRAGLLGRIAAAFIFLVALFTTAPAIAAFQPPPLDGHVLDTAGKLSAAEVLELDAKLDAIRRNTGVEIVAFLPRSLEGEEIEDFAYEAFNAWKLGQKGADNGVLLVIATQERKVRIETGRGVGGALTDLQSNDIIRKTIAPLLQENRFHDAVDAGTQEIAKALSAEAPERARPPTAAPGSTLLSKGFLIGILLLVIVLSIVSPGFRRFLFFVLLFGRGGRGGGLGGGGFGGGGGEGGGSGFSGGGGGNSGGGGSSDSY